MELKYTFEKITNADSIAEYQVRLGGNFFVCYSTHKDENRIDAYLRREGYDSREEYYQACVDEHISTPPTRGGLIVRLAKLKCKKQVTVFGRNDDGSPDHCFFEGKEYLFCVDEKKQEIFTVNEVDEVHFLRLNNCSFTEEHFDILSVENIDFYGLDRSTKFKFTRLYRDKYNYEM